MKYNNSVLEVYISSFGRWGNKMIYWVKNTSQDSILWRSTNNTQINFTGIECSLTISPQKTSAFERIQVIRISYCFLRADSNHYNMLSKYALDYLRHQITSCIDVRIVSKLNISYRLTYNDRNSVYQDAKGQVVLYRPFWLSDAKIYWKNTLFTVFAEASNVFNTLYYDFGGIIQPGIWLRGGIVADLDYKK